PRCCPVEESDTRATQPKTSPTTRHRRPSARGRRGTLGARSARAWSRSVRRVAASCSSAHLAGKRSGGSKREIAPHKSSLCRGEREMERATAGGASLQCVSCDDYSIYCALAPPCGLGQCPGAGSLRPGL